MMDNFTTKTDLLKLKGAFVTNFKGKTATKRCLVIPIDDANLFLGEKGCYLNQTGVKMREERYGDTHILKQNLPREVYDAMTEEERKAMPILGTARPIEAQPPKQMDVTRTTDAASCLADDEDLPF